MKTRLFLAAFLFLIFLTPNVLSQDFIITCDKDVYACLRNCEAICNITNNVSHAVKINITGIFPNYEGLELEDILILENVSYNVTVPIYDYVDVFCYDSETSTYGSWDYDSGLRLYVCSVTNTTLDCESISTTNVENDTCTRYTIVSYNTETRYRNEWKPFDYKWLILLPSNKKGIRGRHENGGNGVAQGSTVTVKFKFKVPISSEGKFDIEVKGDSGEYSLLDPWWNSNWLYRKQVTINENENIYIWNHPVIITFSHDGKANSDCSDIRVVLNDTEIPFGLRNCNSTHVEIAVKLNMTPLSTINTLYVYYGNSTPVSFANTSWEFVANDFYDDFNDGDYTDIWNCIGGGDEGYWYCEETGGYLHLHADYETTRTWSAVESKQKITSYYNVTAIMYAKGVWDSYGAYAHWLYLTHGGTNVGTLSKFYGVARVAAGATGTYLYERSSAGYDRVSVNTQATSNQWYTVYLHGNSTHAVYPDAWGVHLVNPFDYFDYNNTYENFTVGIRVDGASGVIDEYVDWIKVNVNLENEPTYTIGAEETAEYISITLNYTSVDFGSLIPSTTNNPATDNGLYGIEIDTNCDARLTFYSPSTPLTYDTYTIPNENLKFNYTFDTTSYTTLLTLDADRTLNVSSGTLKPYYYLDVPEGQHEGSYSTTKVIEGWCA